MVIVPNQNNTETASLIIFWNERTFKAEVLVEVVLADGMERRTLCFLFIILAAKGAWILFNVTLIKSYRYRYVKCCVKICRIILGGILLSI